MEEGVRTRARALALDLQRDSSKKSLRTRELEEEKDKGEEKGSKISAKKKDSKQVFTSSCTKTNKTRAATKSAVIKSHESYMELRSRRLEKLPTISRRESSNQVKLVVVVESPIKLHSCLMMMKKKEQKKKKKKKKCISSCNSPHENDGDKLHDDDEDADKLDHVNDCSDSKLHDDDDDDDDDNDCDDEKFYCDNDKLYCDNDKLYCDNDDGGGDKLPHDHVIAKFSHGNDSGNELHHHHHERKLAHDDDDDDDDNACRVTSSIQRTRRTRYATMQCSDMTVIDTNIDNRHDEASIHVQRLTPTASTSNSVCVSDTHRPSLHILTRHRRRQQISIERCSDNDDDDEEEEEEFQRINARSCSSAAEEFEPSFGDESEMMGPSNKNKNRQQRRGIQEESTPDSNVRSVDPRESMSRSRRSCRSQTRSFSAPPFDRGNDIPSLGEIEAFFRSAEQQERRKFIERYNFDPAKGRPLRGGRYEWMRL